MAHVGTTEFEIERGGDKVAEILKGWFRIRDSYGIEVAPRLGRRADPRLRGLYLIRWAEASRPSPS
jgi:hypothetical protein